MSTAIEQLSARLQEIKANLTFVAAASTLRPRLGDVVQWEAGAEATALARKFMEEKESRPEGLYGGLLVQTLAAFERYVRQLVDAAVETTVTNAKLYDEIAEEICRRHTVLTGRALISIDGPRDHLVFNYEELAENLASCKAGNTSFRFNASAFSAVVTGGSPEVLEKALKNIAVSDWWDAIGHFTSLQELLGTKGARDTGARVRERLKELWRWRNYIAHGGDEEIALSVTELQEAMDFVGALSAALDQEIHKRLMKKKSRR